MRRSAALLAVLVLAAALLWPGPGFAIGAQPATPTAAGPSIVGSWRIAIRQISGPMTPVPDLASFTADGIMLNSVQPLSPAPPGAPFKLVFASLGHGAWRRSGLGTVSWTFVRLQTDEHGDDLGTVTVSGTAQLSTDGAQVRGSLTYTVADASGKVVATGSGTFTGSRVGVESLATPAATPAS